MTKIKIVDQLEHSECGLACATMICNYFGNKISLSHLREEYGVPNGGHTLLDIKNILEDNNVSFRGIKVNNPIHFSEITCPAILFWKDKHFVVLCKVKNNKFLIADPAMGKKWIEKNEFETHFSKFAIINNGTSINKQKKNQKSSNKSINVLKNLIHNNLKSLITLVIISILIQLFSISVPLLIKKIMDDIYIDKININSNSFIIIAILILLSFYIFNVLRTLIVTKIQVKMDQSLMSSVFRHLLDLPYNFFQNRSTGEIIFRLNSNSYIRQILSERIISIILDTFLLFIYLILMFQYSIKLSLLVITIGIILLFISIINAKKLNMFNEKQIILMSEVQNILTQTVEGILSIKSSNFSDHIYENWKEKFSEQLLFDLKKSKYSAFLQNISKTVQIGLPLIIYLLSVKLYQNGEITVGEIVAFNTISGYFLIPLISLSESYSDLLTLKIYVNKLLDILSTNKEINGTKNLPKVFDIELKDVSYSYSKHSPYVLESINLKIEYGEKVIIVGESGSGKSTLLKVMMGLVEPKSGAVLIGNENLKNISKSKFRSSIGVITQNSQIFNMSILDNIIMKRKIKDEDLKKSIYISGVDKIYRDLNIGNHMIVSEFGDNLSGGQIQKIALARSLAGMPNLFFMDEPTSSLDNISEKKLVDYILSDNNTYIMIAHRFSQIEKFDKIIVIDQGKIVGQGTHNDLLKSNEKYKELYQSKGL